MMVFSVGMVVLFSIGKSRLPQSIFGLLLILMIELSTLRTFFTTWVYSNGVRSRAQAPKASSTAFVLCFSKV